MVTNVLRRICLAYLFDSNAACGGRKIIRVRHSVNSLLNPGACWLLLANMVTRRSNVLFCFL
jgi:hypothetical protein